MVGNSRSATVEFSIGLRLIYSRSRKVICNSAVNADAEKAMAAMTAIIAEYLKYFSIVMIILQIDINVNSLICCPKTA